MKLFETVTSVLREIVLNSSVTGSQFTIATTQLMMSIMFLHYHLSSSMSVIPFVVYGILSLVQAGIMIFRLSHSKFGIAFSLISSFSLWYLFVFNSVVCDTTTTQPPLIASYLAVCLASSWVVVRSGVNTQTNKNIIFDK